MKFKDFDNIGASVEIYYNREWRSWGAMIRNKSGDQLGPAIWSHSKQEAILNKKELKKLIGKEVKY